MRCVQSRTHLVKITRSTQSTYWASIGWIITVLRYLYLDDFTKRYDVRKIRLTEKKIVQNCRTSKADIFIEPYWYFIIYANIFYLLLYSPVTPVTIVVSVSLSSLWRWRSVQPHTVYGFGGVSDMCDRNVGSEHKCIKNKIYYTTAKSTWNVPFSE